MYFVSCHVLEVDENDLDIRLELHALHDHEHHDYFHNFPGYHHNFLDYFHDRLDLVLEERACKL